MKTLFLEQSYKDVNKYLKDNINNKKYDAWDYIVITASNDTQAKCYEMQINLHLKNKLLDRRTKYIVVPDLNNERIGSGGATLNVLIELASKYNVDFNKSKILLIHSGGDSKRIPQYSACGKLFSPIPRELDKNTGATLFDELIAVTSLLPSRMINGVLLLSGDAELLFNPLQIEFKNKEVSALSIKKSVEVGKNHGVFNIDDNGDVIEFLHKKSVEELIAKGAVNKHNEINIDTGVIFFNGDIAKKILSLVEEEGNVSQYLVKQFINSKIRLSFYGDFLYPFSKKAIYNNYLKEAAEGEFCDELICCRNKIWDKLHSHTMNVISVSPGEFLHFGTTREMYNLVSIDIDKYKFLGWQRNNSSNICDAHYSTYNCVVINSNVVEGSYIENSIIKNCNVGKSILSNVEISNLTIPDNVVLSGLKLNDGRYVVRIYGINDNAKIDNDRLGFFGKSLTDFACCNNLKLDTRDNTMWTTSIFPIANTMQKAAEYALKTYNLIINNDMDFFNEWQKIDKTSLEQSYNIVDIDWIIEWKRHLIDEIIEGNIIKYLKSKVNFEDLINDIGVDILKSKLNKIINNINQFDADIQNRSYLLAAWISENENEKKEYYDKILNIVKNQCYANEMQDVREKLKTSTHIQLPVRVNFAGGWTDTPPYCFENGGTVLNSAILLNNNFPINAKVEILKDRQFVFESVDMNVCKVVCSRNEVLACSNPFDRVALQKAAVVAMGIVKPTDEQDLSNVFDYLGGGLKLVTNVIDIPKGSGLGTSSILSCACIKALYEAMGVKYTIQDLSDRVMFLEQLMSTGGGWQDQIGGVINGIKLITSNSGIQKLKIDNIELKKQIKDELNNRFALIYTGQRRLARNLLRNIVFDYLSGKSEVLQALDKIENIAMAMTRKLERGDIDGFAQLMNEHWQYLKLLDKGITNTCIDYILSVCKDLICGQMICGAGGGGFLQVMLKTGVSKEYLNERLKEFFADSDIRVYDSQFVF